MKIVVTIESSFWRIFVVPSQVLGIDEGDLFAIFKLLCDSWDIAMKINFSKLIFFFGPDEDEYVAFGLSGSEEEARMEGSDVAILYRDTYQGYSFDYNITAKSSVIFFFTFSFNSLSLKR